MADEPKKKWTIGQYVFMAGLSALFGAMLIVGGSTAGIVIGVALVALGIGFGLVAAVAKGGQVASSD